MTSLVFLCSSAEPGRDGVGDYTRRLAAELIRRGHPAQVVALHDAVTRRVDERQADGETSVPVLRLPAASPWDGRVAEARARIDELGAEWISLQYVSFGFHPHGLPWRVGRHLRAITATRPLHLMLHELWVRPEPADGSLKRRVWSTLQRTLLARTIGLLHPRVVHTTNELYRASLASIGVRAEILPLFSNVAVHPRSGWLDAALVRLALPVAQRCDALRLGIFGEIPAEWSTDGWLPWLVAQARRNGRRLAVLGIGRTSPAARSRFDAIAREGLEGICIHHFGPRSEAEISDFLQAVDGGIATAPRLLLGKSGSAAAMLGHGLPVLVPRTDTLGQFEAQLNDFWRAVNDPVRTRSPLDLLGVCAGTYLQRLERCATAARRSPGKTR